MIDLYTEMMDPFLKEKREPPQSLLLLICMKESIVYESPDLSLDRKVSFYELIRKAFSLDGKNENSFESC